MIDVRNLVKWYGPTLAVDRITFEIPEGQIVGFLGPNGAGKSTTLRMLTGYLPPSSGQVTVAGVDVLKASDKARSRIGYLPESTPLYPEMRVEEFLHYRGRLMGMSRADRRKRIDLVCDRCGLTVNRRRIIGQLSKGNRQRVGVAQALLHDPPVLVLDEPTAGLDPTQVSHFRDLIQELRGQHTVILSTHILSEVEKTADRAMIIAGGRIAADGSLRELRERIGRLANLRLEARAPAEPLRAALEAIKGVTSVAIEREEPWSIATLVSEKGVDLREAVGEAMKASGWPVRELRHEGGTLEAFFLEITAAQEHGVEAAPAPVA